MTWARKTLAEVADFSLGKMLDQRKNKGSPRPYLANANVRWGGFVLDDLREMRFEDHEVERFGLKQGDVVMCEGGEPGRCAIWKNQIPRMMFQKAIHRIRPHSILDHRFLYYTFLYYGQTGQFAPFFTGATISHLPREKLALLEIAVPPLSIQQTIASILATYDDLIENNTRRIAILEEMAQAIYREWFVNFRFPGHEQVEMVESELGSVPERWEVVSFTEIAEVLSGGTPKTSIPEYWNGAIPFFTPRDAPSTFHVLGTEKSITEEGLNKCSSRLYPEDTVFITARGTVGKVALPAEPMAMNQSCYALQGRNGVDQLFVFFSIRQAVDKLQQRAHGAVFDTIILDTFKRLMVIQPPPKVVNAFVRLVRPIADQSLSLSRKNAVLRHTRDLLLPKLISGEIEVAAMEEELALAAV